MDKGGAYATVVIPAPLNPFAATRPRRHRGPPQHSSLKAVAPTIRALRALCARSGRARANAKAGPVTRSPATPSWRGTGWAPRREEGVVLDRQWSA
jgi:hypothetical protein